MRILLVTGSFPPMKCGVGNYAASLAEALGKLRDIQVSVLTHTEARTARSDRNFEIFPIIHGWKMSDISRVVKILRHWKPDIVHLQYPTQGYRNAWLPWLLPIMLHWLNVKTVQTWHEPFPMVSLRFNLPAAITPGGLIVVRANYKSSMSPWEQWLIRHKQFQYIHNASGIPRLEISETERSAIHQQFAPLSAQLVVYFGFMYAHKGVDLLFEIADPARHHLVLIGEFNHEDPYHKVLRERMQGRPWAGKVTATGFLPSEQAAKILAAADAVVLPFRNGGGMWNTSLHGAIIQGTFVLTTSHERHGYEPAENIYYAWPGNVEDMRQALQLYIGRRNCSPVTAQYYDWASISEAHANFYKACLE